MSKCDEALDAMTTLNHAFKTREYRDYLEGFARSMSQDGHVYDEEADAIVRESRDPEYTRSLVAAAMVNVEVAEPVWVSAPVVSLVDFAATHETFEPEPFYPPDIWTPHAFALLEEPLRFIDIKGLEVAYRAISWSITGQVDTDSRGVLICLWSHNRDTDGYRPEPGFEFVRDPTESGDDPDLFELQLLGGSPFVLAHVGIIPFGPARFLKQESIAPLVAQFECLWRLARDTIVMPKREQATRHARKRATRAGRPVHEVTVLRLRRVMRLGESDDIAPSGHTGREMSRHVRRGFWRKQWYPSREEHKQIWIEQTIVRPDRPGEIRRGGTLFDR